MISFQSLKTYIKNTPKGVLAIGAIGVCSLVIAILLVLSANNTTQTNTNSANTSSSSSGSSREQGADSATNGVVAGSSTTASSTSAQSQPTGTGTRTNNSTSGNASVATPPQVAPGQPVLPKADYNLNEIWYFATATTGGLYNTCWPTALNESNEAQCADPGSIYSHPNTIFKGIGISKSAGTAQTLAANQAHEKALAQHVDPRIGGGDDAIVLTEVLCAQYSLSCGRW